MFGAPLYYHAPVCDEAKAHGYKSCMQKFSWLILLLYSQKLSNVLILHPSASWSKHYPCSTDYYHYKVATVCIRAQYSLSYTEKFTWTMDEQPRCYTKWPACYAVCILASPTAHIHTQMHKHTHTHMLQPIPVANITPLNQVMELCFTKIDSEWSIADIFVLLLEVQTV